MRHFTQNLTRTVAAAALIGASLAAPWPAHAVIGPIATPVGAGGGLNPEVNTGPIETIPQEFAVARILNKADALGPAFTGRALAGWETVPGGYRVRYQRCDIYTASNGTQAFEVRGDIRDKYNAIGGPGAIGLPVTDDETAFDRTGRYNHFSGDASIYWHPHTGPMVVRGAIRSNWIAQGAESSWLGYPISDQRTVGPGEAYSMFQNGVLFSGSAGVESAPSSGLSWKQVQLKLLNLLYAVRSDEYGFPLAGRITNVSDTDWSFWESRGRIITILVDTYDPDPLDPPFAAHVQLDLLFYVTRDRDSAGQETGGMTVWLNMSQRSFSASGDAGQASYLQGRIGERIGRPMPVCHLVASQPLCLEVSKAGDLQIFLKPGPDQSARQNAATGVLKQWLQQYQ